MVKPFKVIEQFINIQDNIAGFIANGPSEGIGGHIRDQYRNRCDQFANLPGWARALGNGSTGSMNRICTPYWDAGGFDGPLAELPFEGGQCECTTYDVTITASYTNNNDAQVTASLTQRIRGPLISANAEFSAGLPNRILYTIVANNAGSSAGSSGACRVGLPPLTFTFRPSNASVKAGTSVSVSGVDLGVISGPDDCGNPPAEIRPGPNPPPDPGPTPGPEPTDDPDGGPIPDLPIPPYEDPDFGPIPIEPGDEPGGGGGEPGPPAGGDGLPGQPDSVSPPAGQTGNDGEGQDFEFGPPPPGKVWVGVLIENTVDSRYGNIPGTGPQNTVYPYVIGNASLIYAGGYSSSSRMRSRWHEMYRPVTALQITGARVQCRPGVSASVRPVSATICPENPCET